jgi:poly-gamma-glutamate synthesis protein (capsule biosynthesis protein)
MPRSLMSAALLGAALAAGCTTAAEPTTSVPPTEAALRTPEPTNAATSVPVATTDTTTSTTVAPTTTTVAPKRPIVLGFAGDTSFTNGLDARDPFGDVIAELSAPDLMAVNLETTVAEVEVGTRVDKEFTFKSPPHSIELLTAAGIDAVQLANNHTLDFMRPAMLRTLELLDQADLPHAGAGTDPDAAYAPTFLDVGDWRIGVVAFSRVPCDWSASGENTRPEVAWTCDVFVDDAAAAVGRAAGGADVVVVMVHWGIEGDHCPQPFQRQLAQAWADAGADLVIGGHPHVLQGVERVGDAWLVNSTGNFAFPSARDATARTAIFEFTVSDDETTLHVIPVRVASGRPAPATGDDAASILSDLGRWSFGYVFDDSGAAIPTDEPSDCE